MLNDYCNQRNLIINHLENFLLIARERKNEKLEKDIVNLRSKLENNKFYIAAFGGFSSGKSTFFNALIGEKLFPTLHTPTTASINFLSYNETPSVNINYKTKEELIKNINDGIEEYKNANKSYPLLGTNRQISIEELLNISKENPESIYIKDIIVNYDSENLKPKDVIWIDTPGTGSVIEYHKELTYNLIDSADAILFFIYAPIPFTNEDWIFLKDIKNVRNAIKSDKFFFIVTAIDALEDQTVDEVVSFIRTKLETKAGILKPQIIPISSKLAFLAQKKLNNRINQTEEREYKKILFSYTEDIEKISPQKAIELSNFEKLKSVLSDFINNEKAKLLINSSVDRARIIYNDLLRGISLEIWSLNKSVEELDDMINNKLLPELEQKENSINEIIEKIEKELHSIRPNFDRLKIEIDEQLENQIYDTERINIKNIEDTFDKHIYIIKKDLESKIIEIVNKYYHTILDLFNDFDTSFFNNISFDPEIDCQLSSSALARINASDFVKGYESNDSGGGGLFGFLLGALFGGIFGAIIGGSVLGGALIGGTAGSMGAASSSASTMRKIVDLLGMKKAAKSKVEVEINNLKEVFNDLIDEYIDKIIEFIENESKNKITNIREEINKIKNKRKEADLNREKKLVFLNEQISKLNQSIKNISLLRIDYEEKELS